MIGVEDAKVPVIDFEIPGGYITKVRKDDKEETVSLYKVRAREMQGWEEDILSEEDSSIIDRFHRIVGSCLLRLSDDNGNEITDRKVLVGAPDRLLMSDLLVCILKIRQCTVGDDLRWQVNCPNCTTVDATSGKENPTKFTALYSLADLKIDSLEGDRLKRVREFTTPRGNVVTWEMMNGLMERSLEKIRAKKKDRATAGLMVRVKTINGVPCTFETLKDLGMQERQRIRKDFENEGGVDTDIDVVCHKCGHKFKTSLEITGGNFFGLSETLED